MRGSRWRQEFWALRGITFRASPGDVIGVIGPNGSGKTTLLKTLAGILSADRGRAIVSGRIACLLNLRAGFNSHLTGRENIYLNGTMLGLRRGFINERLSQILELSELGDFIDAPVHTYSAGMLARLGFSIAIHTEPDVLLLDEVLGAGDARFRSRTGSILERYRDGRRTIVLANHSMEMIRKDCNRVVWLEAGTIRMDGSPNEVTEAYLADAKARRSLAAPTSLAIP